jgi:NAD(P)H-hydrate epimerase
VVLLKGPTTVVAGPDGTVLLVRAGDSRLATAGTGDVLTGIVAALLACGATPLRAAGAAAQLHGLAADHGPERGLVASDLVALLPAVWSELMDGAAPGRA